MYLLTETDSYRNREHDRPAYITRGGRGGRSYRGRGGRGGRGAYRGSFRQRHDQVYMQVMFIIFYEYLIYDKNNKQCE